MKVLAAITLSLTAFIAVASTNINDSKPVGRLGSSGFYCFVGPVLGGNDELDASGMGAPVTWGRECGTQPFPSVQPTINPVLPTPPAGGWPVYKIPAGGM